MGNPTEAESVFFDNTSLKPADNSLLTAFTTTGWTGMNILFVDATEGKHRYPYFADSVDGYIPNCERSHPLRQVEDALSQRLHTDSQPLRGLSYYTGQIARIDRDMSPQKWEREEIAKRYVLLGSDKLAEPGSKWRRADFIDYYADVRKHEAEVLRAQVRSLAGVIATQNQAEQLYVERQNGLRKGTGWLAPLVGLVIDTGNTNEYSKQVHDVLPIVRQSNDTITLFWGADASLYTAYAHAKGIR